jgi:hypothetical protein
VEICNVKDTETCVGIDATRTMYPSRSRLVVLKHNDTPVHATSEHTTTFYLVVYKGRVRVELTDSDDAMELGERAYLSATGAAVISPIGDAVVYIIERLGYRGQRQAGIIEAQGRLSYIDGCSDSLLVYPSRMGDPCLNYLHFPKGILQTQHLHPSIRLGLVLRGAGKAWGPGWEIPLVPGVVFQLNEQEIHSFATPDESMDIVAYHPDSDWGPVDGNHPMLNRTYIRHGQPR